MASTHKSLRSSTASKRPTTSIADGQIALNTNAASPGLFFKDSTGADIIKVGPVHVGTTAPNATPAAGGSSGNSTGEVWLDTSLTPIGVKIWDGSAWQNATPAGSTTVKGLLELATNGETQTGTDTARAVTPAGLQSKLSDSTSTTSSTTIASSTAVKSAYDLANAALPKSGGVITGNLEIGATGSLTFEGATDNAFETALAVVDPTADRTITFPDRTGTVITNADTGTVTSTMIADGTIVNADVNASAAIAGTKISPNFGSQTVQTTGVISHALGTAGAPTITFTGDTNTGVYSPGADQVAISTNGTGRLFVDASGRVALGGTTVTDSNLFNIQGSTATDNVGVVLNKTNGTAQVWGIQNGGALTFFNYTSSTAALTVDTNNRIGLGTSSPSTILDIAGEQTFSAGGAGWRSAAIKAIDEGASFKGSLAFYTHPSAGAAGAPTERVRINSSGNVGIGTTSPTAALNVSTGGTDLVADFVGTSSPYIRINNGTKSYIAQVTGSDFRIQNQTDSTECLRIDSSGNVGIGTTSPGAVLESKTINVQPGDAAYAKKAVITNIPYSTSNVTSSAVAIYDGTIHAADIGYSYDGTGYYLTFGTNDNTVAAPIERLRIDSSGNVGIGTTSPIALYRSLSIHGNATDEGGVLDLATSNQSSRAYVFNDSNGLSLQTATAHPILIKTNNAERLRITSDGKVGLGTSSPSSYNASANDLVVGNHTGAHGVTICSQNNSSGYIMFADGTTGAETYAGQITYDHTNNRLTLGTNDGTTGLTVDSSQRVGIGTTSPAVTLHVASGDARISDSGATQRLLRLSNSSGAAEYRIQGDGNSYLYNDGYLAVSTGGGTERARIDSSGRLLVGTSSTSSEATVLLQGNNNGSTLDGTLRFARGTSSPAADSSLGKLDFGDSGHTSAARIQCLRDGGTWTSGSSQPTKLTLSTTSDGSSSPTQRMKINRNGDVNFYNLTQLYPETDNTVSLGLSGFRWSAVWAANGTIQTSDQRTKTQITDAALGSDFIKSLRPVSYRWIEGGKRDTGERDEDGNYIYESVPGTRTHWGFIAQEVKQVVDAAGVDFGGWVLTDKDDPDSQQALRYDQFIAPLTKALQETMAELEALKAEVAALKGA